MQNQPEPEEREHSDHLNRCQNLKMCHINIQSLGSGEQGPTSTANAKLDQLRTILQHQHHFNVIAVSETWLTGCVSEEDIALDNYEVHRKDRRGRGGGVCMYINTALATRRRTDLEMEDIEIMWIQILFIPKPVLVGVSHRHAHIIDDSSEYLSFPDWWMPDYFNVARQSRDKNSVDNIFVSSSLFEKMADFTVESRDESDHFPISCSLSCSINLRAQDITRNTRPFPQRYLWDSSKCEHFQSRLCDDVTNTLLESMTENIDRLNVDAAVSDFVNIFQHAGEPMKCKSNSSKRRSIHNNNKRRKPHANWWDCECQEAKEIKISKLRGYRSSRSEQDFAVYLEAKKHFKRMCRKKSLDFNRTFYKD